MSSTVHAGADRPPLLRTVLVGQLAMLGATVVVTALWLGRMAAAGVGPGEMTTGAYDPKDMVPYGLSGTNAFTWLYGLLMLLFLAGLAVAPLLAGYSVLLLVRDRAGMTRRIWRLLLAVTVAAAVVTVLRLAPIGTDLTRWWLD
ncbi:hypothetical protein [Micromonospora endolithica]|uniref:Uncharacterized protein n=1 Tax=Micromonospora endolithica TaxID=230091 RepID=A0A3A9ZIV2_9ACTN|nr:hypothetical protein [Micromonospora endolithica]RKN48331.1 hypothetical protein D7223_09975 [Micromonospora endolithica]TWJ24607.1 hypothetical protein JD76_04759 [Micromonospora endolithica]